MPNLFPITLLAKKGNRQSLAMFYHEGSQFNSGASPHAAPRAKNSKKYWDEIRTDYAGIRIS